MKKIFDLNKVIKTVDGTALKTARGELFTIRFKIKDSLEALVINNREAVSFSDSSKSIELAKKVWNGTKSIMKFENSDWNFIKSVCEKDTNSSAIIKHYLNKAFDKGEQEYTKRESKKEKKDK